MTQVSRLHAVDMTEISGSARPAFAALIAEIQERLSTGEELGLSPFVDVEGDPVVDERIAGPLGADFHIGVPATEVHRVADIEPPPGNFDLSFLDTGSIAYRTLTIGQVLSTISRSGDGPNGRFLSTATVDLIFCELTNGVDMVNGLDLRWGTGFALPSPAVPWIPDGRIAFWGGMGAPWPSWTSSAV